MQLPHLVQPWRWQHLSFWRSILVIGGTFLLLLVISYRLSLRHTSLLLFAFAASWVVFFFWRWPNWALVGFVPVTMLLDMSDNVGLRGYANEPMLLVALLTALWLLEMIVHQGRISLVRSRPLLPLLALVISVLLAFANGQLLWFLFANPAPLPAQLAGAAIFLLSAAAFLLVANRVRELRWLRYMTWLFLAIGGLFIVGRLAPFLGLGRVIASGVHGSLFWVWLVALSLSQALFNRELKMGWRLGLVALAVATLATGFFQARDWASGWGPALVTAVAVVWLRSWRLGLALTLLGVAAKLAIDPGFLNDLVAADEYSIVTRWMAWEIVLGQIVRVSPLLGLGPANYYHFTPLFPILGWYVQFNSHNQYVDLVAQVGFLGLFCFLWFVWQVGRLGWRLRAQAADGFARAYVYAALAALVGTLVAAMLADWVVPFIYNIGLKGFRSSVLAWLFMGGLVAIEQMSKKGQ
jgi:hypothetical protein